MLVWVAASPPNESTARAESLKTIRFMTPADRESVLLAVPVGRENAVGAVKIEETVGLWSLTAIKRHLAALVSSGQIHSMSVRAPNHHDVIVYYRSNDR